MDNNPYGSYNYGLNNFGLDTNTPMQSTGNLAPNPYQSIQINDNWLTDIISSNNYNYGLNNFGIDKEIDPEYNRIRTLYLLEKMNPIKGIKFNGNIKNISSTISRTEDSNEESWFNKNKQNIGSQAGTIADTGTAIMDIAGWNKDYSGDYGYLASSLDSAYNGVANGLISSGTPWGIVAGGAMKVNGAINQAAQNIGLGTDNMTQQDAILGSNFLAPIGWINGGFGSKANTFKKDDQLLSKIGGSYQGFYNIATDAGSKSGKKYGLFSQNAKDKANAVISKAKNQQSIIQNIADEASDRFNIRNGNTVINSNRLALDMQGGYRQNLNRLAKKGMKVQKGRTIEQLIDYANQVNPRFIQRLKEPYKKPIYYDNGDYATHLLSYGSNTDESGKEHYYIYSNIQEDDNGNLKDYGDSAFNRALELNDILEVDSPEEAELFTNSGKDNDGNYYGYKLGYRDWFENFPSREFFDVKSHKQGGTVSYIEFTVDPTYIDITIDDTIDSFKNGGEINVIPEGALHARKNNMDIKGITNKGIPVISEENGKIQQHAEIERCEIILRKEVTEKLEKLRDQYNENKKDEFAIEAGKLLVDEILNNTQDNVGLI